MNDLKRQPHGPTPSTGSSDETSDGDAISQRPGLSDEVYERLVDDLITLKLPPGERLSVDGLARRFGVSQTPTRGALIRLEAEGLVVKRHYSGYFVAPLPTAQRMEEIFELRSLIEPFAAEKTATNGSEAQIAAIRAIVDDMQTLLNEGERRNSTALVMLDNRFHSAIAEASGSAMLFEVLTKLFTQLHIFRVRIHSNVVEDVVGEHDGILAAIERRDGHAARDMMQAHIDAARGRIEGYVQQAL